MLNESMRMALSADIDPVKLFVSAELMAGLKEKTPVIMPSAIKAVISGFSRIYGDDFLLLSPELILILFLDFNLFLPFSAKMQDFIKFLIVVPRAKK